MGIIRPSQSVDLDSYEPVSSSLEDQKRFSTFDRKRHSIRNSTSILEHCNLEEVSTDC